MPDGSPWWTLSLPPRQYERVENPPSGEPKGLWPIPLTSERGRTGPRAWWVGALIAAAFWLLLALALGAMLLFEWQGTRTDPDLGCPAVEGDSLYGPSTWRWWPPGAVCHWDGRRTDEPGPLRGAWTLAVVLGGVTLLVAVPVRVRSRAEPDHSGGC